MAGPHQDVLTWARQSGSATSFIKRINREGSANDGTALELLVDLGEPRSTWRGNGGARLMDRATGGESAHVS